MTDKMPELKSCPFCGGAATYDYSNGKHWITCDEVTCRGNPIVSSKMSKEDATDAWSTRAPTPAPSDAELWICERKTHLPEHDGATGYFYYELISPYDGKALQGTKAIESAAYERAAKVVEGLRAKGEGFLTDMQLIGLAQAIRQLIGEEKG